MRLAWTVLIAASSLGCSELDLVVAARLGDASVDDAHLGECAGDIGTFSAGEDHLCAADGQGDLFCVGQNGFGQLGDGTDNQSSNFVRVALSSSVQSVAGGDDHTCAITDAAELWCWGRNDLGQLGNGTNVESLSPVQIGQGYVMVSTALNSTCAIDSNGALWCWGHNDAGQLGVGDLLDRNVPTTVQSPDGGSWLGVSIFETHACGITRADGVTSLWCWGSNTGDQLGVAGAPNQLSPLLVDADSWQTVSVGLRHSCALKSDSSLWCWGDGNGGRLGLGDTEDREVPTVLAGSWRAVSAGRRHTCAIHAVDDAVYCWGLGLAVSGISETTELLVPTVVRFAAEPVSATVIDTSDEFTCARSGASLVCWGENNNGELALGMTSEAAVPTLVCPE